MIDMRFVSEVQHDRYRRLEDIIFISKQRRSLWYLPYNTTKQPFRPSETICPSSADYCKTMQNPLDPPICGNRPVQTKKLIYLHRQIISLADSSSTIRFAIGSQRLRKLAALADRRSFPVENVDWNDNQTGQTSEDGTGVFDGVFTAEIGVEGCGVHCCDT